VVSPIWQQGSLSDVGISQKSMVSAVQFFEKMSMSENVATPALAVPPSLSLEPLKLSPVSPSALHTVSPLVFVAASLPISLVAVSCTE